MVRLNSSKCFLFLLITVSFQQRPRIDVEKVRADFMATEEHNIPVEFLQKQNCHFREFYIGNECLVHLNYKEYASEPHMKLSAIAVYHFSTRGWILDKFLPYYYDISLLDSSQLVFVSQNLFCEPNGTCASYTEVNVYKDHDFREIVKYHGFKKDLYYYGLLGRNKKEKITEAIGDTIVNEFVISDLTIQASSKLSFKLQHNVCILKNVAENLDVTRKTKSSIVKIDF